MSHISIDGNKKNNKRVGRNSSRGPVSRAQQAVKKSAPSAQSQIISGYFETEKSYKEIAIARVNSFLCLTLAFLVSVCLVCYYFVITGEVKLNQIRKETLALNYENEDLQNKLDNLQSYYNIDKTISKSNMLQRATQVMELSAADLPKVEFKNKEKQNSNAWSMGY